MEETDAEGKMQKCQSVREETLRRVSNRPGVEKETPVREDTRS